MIWIGRSPRSSTNVAGLFEGAVAQREKRLVSRVARVNAKRAEVERFGRRASFLSEDLQDLGKLVADGRIVPDGIQQ